MSAKQMINIAEAFQRADRALVACPAFARYCEIGNYQQAIQDAADEKCPWPEGPEPAPLTGAELLELEPLWAARADAWVEWSDLVHRAMRGHLTVEERATAVREATRKGQIGTMFAELVETFHAARRWT